MSDTGAIGPSSVDQSGANTAWTNINNSLALDGSYATCATVYSKGAGTTNSLDETFPDMDIPEDADIVGIEVAEHAYISADGSAWYISSAVKIGGQTKTDGTPAIGGTQTWDGTLRTYTYGGPTDLWGGTWAPSDFTAPIVSVVHSGGDGNPTFQLDYVSLKIYYSVAGTTVTSDIAAAALLGARSTKDVAASARFNASFLADVTGRAALSQESADSISAAAVLGLFHDAGIVVGTRISVPAHTDLAAASRLGAIETSDVDGAVVIGQATRLDVDASVALSAVFTSDVAAGIQLQNVHTLPHRLPAGVARVSHIGACVARVSQPPPGIARVVRPARGGTARMKPPGGGY